MTKIWLILLITVIFLGCATVPQPGATAFFDDDIGSAKNIALQKIELNLRPGSGNINGLVQDLAVQAAGQHGFRLVVPQKELDSTESPSTRITLSLTEREYSLDLDSWNSVVVSARLSDPQLQILLTEDTHLSCKSAGYLFSVLDRLFGLLQQKLDTHEKR